MKIVCPSCAASYDVPDAVALSKRTVRCARCGGDWVPSVPESADAAIPASPAPGPDPVPAAPKLAPAAATPPAAEAAAQIDLAALEPQAPPPAVPPANEPAAVAMAGPAPEPVLEPPAPRPMPRQNAASAIAPPPPPAATHSGTREPLGAWLISLIILISLIGASLAFKNKIIEIWPPSTRVYAALGLYQR